MNIKCLFNKHDYVPIQYVDETTDYEWTYIVHCSRCHKESVHDMGEKDKEININWYCVVDFADDYVLFMGTLESCNEVMEQNYAGLQVVSHKDITYQMKLQLHNDFD